MVLRRIDMPTPESPSASSNYTLWVCPHHPRPHFNPRVKYQTFQTKFLWKTINTVRLLTLSSGVWIEIWKSLYKFYNTVVNQSIFHYSNIFMWHCSWQIREGFKKKSMEISIRGGGSNPFRIFFFFCILNSSRNALKKFF